MRPQKIQQIVLASRPTTIPSEDNFAFQDVEWPSLKNEEVLIHTLFLSVDPYMRGRMNDRPSYIAPFQIDQPITGGIVGEVIESKSPHFKVGDNVVGFSNWANFNIALAKDL